MFAKCSEYAFSLMLFAPASLTAAVHQPPQLRSSTDKASAAPLTHQTFPKEVLGAAHPDSQPLIQTSASPRFAAIRNSGGASGTASRCMISAPSRCPAVALADA